VLLTATDKAGEEITDTFKVTVLNTNDAPTLANAIADQQASEDDEFELQGAGLDLRRCGCGRQS
jgi:hypothetical protein